MILALLAALAAPAPNAPHPAEPKLFKDWTVGCDNGRACLAVALQPETQDLDQWLTLDLERGAAAEARPRIEIDVEAPAGAGGYADGKRLPVALGTGKRSGEVTGGADSLVAALRSASRLEVRDPAGKRLGFVSLAGASAALLYMDDRQGRVGTVTALARPGPRPASSVPPPPPIPVVRAAPAGTGRAIALAPARAAALRREQGCLIDEVGGPDEIEMHKLDGHRTLVLLSCGSGAYNLSMIPLIAVRRAGRVEIATAPFDSTPEQGEAGKPVLVNPEWD